MPTIVATKFPTAVSIVSAPVAKGLLIGTNIAAGYHEQDSIMLHQRPDLAYPLHHTANGLPYAAFVDDKIVRERGLRMVSHSDLLPYSDEKAMQMLSAQWKQHAGTYWTTVEECYTSMAVGYVSRNVPSSDSSSSTVFDSHSVPSEARVLTCKPSLKTVDSLFFTGEKEHARKSVSFAEQRSQTQRKRTEACTGSLDGPVINIASVECELFSTLLISQNAASLSNCDFNSPLYQSLPLNVKYIVDVESDLTSLACADGTDVANYSDPLALVWDLKANKRSVTPSQSHGTELTMTYLRETAMNVHNLGGLDMASQGTLLLDQHKCKRNIAHEMFLVRHSSMGECALAESSFFDSQIDSLKPASMAASSGGFITDELDNPLTDDQKLALLEIAGNIKCGHLKMMSVEFDAVDNDLCTEYMSADDHDDPDLCLTKENTYKRKCNIFDTGASQNVEQDRSAFVVYFELQVPIPMRQGEGVLYATGMGIVIYNFERDDHSVYSEPGFALHTPEAKAGMSIISKASFQGLGFGYMAPPFGCCSNPVFTGSTDYWFPHTWFPNPVPMVLDQALSAGMRTIRMYSNNNSNLSLIPVYDAA